MNTYMGSCHCGEIKFEVKAEIKMAIECNCSMCSRKGTILGFVTPEQFTLVSGEGAISNYRFYKKVIDHSFCKNCGVTPFLTGKDKSGNTIKAINVRCLEDFDLKSLAIKQVDGRSL